MICCRPRPASTSRNRACACAGLSSASGTMVAIERTGGNFFSP